MARDPAGRPAELEGYWKKTLEELSQLPPAPEIDTIPLRSTDFATMYGVKLTSIGPYRLFAYLSIPTGTPPFPAVYYLPGYGSVHSVPAGPTNAVRARYVTFSIAVRGQRNSDWPFAARFPGLLTEGIEDPATYVFRGIVADCYRGVEYLVGRPEVDPKRVAAEGNDLALIVASLSPQLTHVVCTPQLFYDVSRLAPATSAYPLEEINDFLRLYPDKAPEVFHTLAYFDPRWSAPEVRAETLLIGGAEGEPLDRQRLLPLLQALGQKATFRQTEHSGYKDGVFVEEWLAHQFRFDKAILPEHWQ